MASQSNAFVPPEHLAYVIKCKKTQFVNRLGEFQVKTWTLAATTNQKDPKNPGRFKFSRGGPDDQTYINHPELLDLVPRAFSELFKKIDAHYVLIDTIKGMRKFDGLTPVDEDEAPFEGATEEDTIAANKKGMTDMRLIKQWETNKELMVFGQEKANGKCLAFVLVPVDGEFILFGGSKNVHVPFVFNDPIEHKNNALHYDIMKVVQKDLMALSDVVRRTLRRRCIIGEYVDNQHIVFVPNTDPFCVYFNCSDLPQPRTIIPPMMNRMPTQEELDKIRKINEIDGNLVEGIVMVMLNTRTQEIFRNKWKTNLYILLRSWREVMSKLKDSTPGETANLLTERTMLRSRQFLNLTPEELGNYRNLIHEFVSWFFRTHYTFSDVSPFSQYGMGKIWHQFTHQTCECRFCVANPWKVVEPVEQNQSPLTTTLLTPESFLAIPVYYKALVAAVTNGFNVSVITVGAPGSGKSTFASLMKADLASRGVSCEVFTTDDEFMVEGKYVFDPKNLGRHHATNLRKFCESTARVRVNANTNLNRRDYFGYVQDATNKGNICMVLSMKPTTDDVLVKRNTHGVPADKIASMNSSFFIAVPAYEGIFVTQEYLKQQFAERKLELPEIKQKAPLHITCKFVGGAKNYTVDPRIGQGLVKFTALGISTHAAGTALVVKPHDGFGGNHITLTTNEKFKPVDVGTGIKEENTVKFPEPFELEGSFLLMF